jgi:hypothetical protein
MEVTMTSNLASLRRAGTMAELVALTERSRESRSARLRSAVAGVVAALGLSACATLPPAPQAPPDHLLFMVFDQMRPDYIDRFGLEHFKRLRASARNYPDGYVGHLSSQTVVAHLVIPTGLPPGALPWADDMLVDVDGTIGTPGLAYNTGQLSREHVRLLLQKIPREQFLPARLQDALGGRVFAVGEKDYAAGFLGGPYASAIVTLARDAEGQCRPDGVNVPDYILSNPRFTLECKATYGTDFRTIYKIDGSRYVPGQDSSRPGGDVWTADAAIAIMAREPWSGLFLTFGGIDKIGHMLGEQDDHGLQSVPSEYHLADVLRTADAQLGRLLDTLERQGLADRTLVVVTADHGGQKNEFYLGNNGSQSCCGFENSTSTVRPPYWLDHLNEIGHPPGQPSLLRTAYAATSVTLWLASPSAENEQAIARGLRDVSGITEIYALRQSAEGYHYEQVFSALEAQPPQFQAWARRHSAELMAAMAGPAAPHLVGLLADGFGFGRIGDHGGAQERVQRIPMIIRVPGEAPSTRTTPLRLMDLSQEITTILGLGPAPMRPRGTVR